MAEVVQVDDPRRPGRALALKRVRADMGDEPAAIRSLLDEAKVLDRLDHPNVARLLEVVKVEDRVGLLFERVAGLDLQTLLRIPPARERAWPLPLSLYVVAEVLEGLDVVHGAKDENGRFLRLVHRDVSPGNVMVDASGRVTLIDFGIAKSALSEDHTEAGAVKGKYRYMAPEQIRGEPAEPGTDVFGAALLLWELLSGERLYDRLGVAQLMFRVSNAHLPDLGRSRPDLSPALLEVLGRATAASLEDRYRSARAFQEALLGTQKTYPRAELERALAARVAQARTEHARAGLERALAEANDVAPHLEGAILAALEAPDRVEGPRADPSKRRPSPRPAPGRAVPLLETPAQSERAKPPSVPSETEEVLAPR